MVNKDGDILTKKEAEKKCRIEAKKYGLVFKKHKARVNNNSVYYYEGRKTGRVYRSMLFITTAYEIACSGELKNYTE